MSLLTDSYCRDKLYSVPSPNPMSVHYYLSRTENKTKSNHSQDNFFNPPGIRQSEEGRLEWPLQPQHEFLSVSLTNSAQIHGGRAHTQSIIQSKINLQAQGGMEIVVGNFLGKGIQIHISYHNILNPVLVPKGSFHVV